MKFDVLNRVLDPFQTLLLEASAGTGKTFSIEHLVVRLLIESDAPLSLEKILVVTFTRAATRELKLRIRAAIAIALQSLERRDASIDYLKKQLEEGPLQAIFRLRAALASADEMQIFTIHGFCHKVLSEFAFEAEESFSLPDPDEEQQHLALKSTVFDFLRTGLHPSKYGSSELAHFFKTGKLKSHCSQLAALVGSGIEIPPLLNFEEQRKAFETLLQGLPQIKKTHFLEDYQNSSVNYKLMGRPVYLEQVEFLADLLEKRSCSLEEFDLLFRDEDHFLKKIDPSNLKVKVKEVFCHYPGLFEQLRIGLERKHPLLLRLARDCRERWEKVKNAATPDELLLKMQRALVLPEFLKRVREKYDAVIVDEFQDTDPIQWKIFKTLFLKRCRAFYLVGDPKQSIYAFRNADLQTYLKAKEDLGASAFLDTNYRSEPKLVHALNALFSYLPGGLSGLAVPHVEAGSKKEETHWQDGKGHLHFLLSEEETEVFSFIAAEIQKHKGVGTIAVLIKDRYQGAKIYQFLKKWNIPAIVKRGDSLLVSPAFFALRDLLFAVNEPKNRSLIKRVLGGPFFGWTAKELQERDLQEHLLLFHEWNLLYLDRGFGAFIGAFLKQCPLLPDLVSPFRQLVEIFLERGEDPLLLIGELASVEDQELFAERQEEDEGKVVIMTTFMSKGLEFDLVFALGLSGEREFKESWIQFQGKGIPYQEKDPKCQAIRQEQKAELLRQFYVALTRAKKRAYVFVDREQKESASMLFCAALGKELTELLDEMKTRASVSYSVLSEETFSLTKMETKEEEALSVKEAVHIQGVSQSLLSFSALAQKMTGEGEEVERGGLLPPGAETGHLLHRILEKAVLDSEEVAAIVKQELKLTLLAEWEEEVVAMVNAVLEMPLDGGTLKEVAKENLFQEMEFLFPHHQNWIKGFIDLVFIRGNKYYFIDWKSNLLSDYTPETIHKAMQECDYFLQAKIYAEALERYFALFPQKLEFGGALYVFLRGPAVHHFMPGEFV